MTDKIKQIIDYLKIKYYKIKYKDYEDNEFNYNSIKHIWGVPSSDSPTPNECNLYTMNDIDIIYNRDCNLYTLSIESIYNFKNKEYECEYLLRLLREFYRFMKNHNYDTNHQLKLSECNMGLIFAANSIGELYAKFKIFVEGYCSVYMMS